MKYRTLMITSALALLTLALIALIAKHEPLVGAQGQPASNEELNKKIADLEKSVSDLRKSDEEGLKAISALSLTDPPVGTIMAFAGEFPPMRDKTRRWTEEELGWMTCNGRELKTSTYEEVFRAIGFSWGKKSDNEFYLPNLGGRFLRGIDTGQNLDPDKASRTNREGNVVGAVVGSLQKDEFKKHGHGITDPGHSHTTNRGIQGDVREEVEGGSGASTNGWDCGGFCSAIIQPSKTNITVNPEGTSSETRPKNAYVHYIIKFKSSRSFAP